MLCVARMMSRDVLDSIMPRTHIHDTDFVSLHATADEHLVLLGVINGQSSRRHIIRRAFTGLHALRVLFVVTEQCREVADDLLRVSGIRERVGVVQWKPGETPSGTRTSVQKTIAFLEYAAAQRTSRWVARMDDDVFVHPTLIGRYTSLIPDERAIVGVYEWYNVVQASLVATGHGYGARGSRGFGRALHNCSPTPNSDCVGPVAFAKGPLVLMTTVTARAAIGTSEFARTKKIVNGAYNPRKRIHDDVLMGWWVSRVPNVTYVRIPRKRVWLDRTPDSIDLTTTICAHKMHMNRVERAIKAAAAVPVANRVFAKCLDSPPCRDCVHDSSQRTCFLALYSNRTVPFQASR